MTSELLKQLVGHAPAVKINFALNELKLFFACLKDGSRVSLRFTGADGKNGTYFR